MAESDPKPKSLDDVVTVLQAGNRNTSELVAAIDNRNGFVVGSNVQGYSAILAALAGLSPSADQFPYFTGAASMSLASLTNTRIETITWVLYNGGAVIATGVQGDLEIPYACTINRATLLADQSGSIVVDIWKDTYANYPPTGADSICASAKPTITTATKSQDSTLTGWVTSIAAGDTLRFNVDSVTTLTRVTLSLKVTKT